MRHLATALPEIRAHLERLRDLARDASGLIVELGVRSGESTRALLESGRCVTSYDIDGDAYQVRKMLTPDESERWTCCQSDSAEAGRKWDRGSVGLLFIDTDHSLETTRAELAAWRPHIVPDGIIALHDVDLHEPGRDGVRPAALEVGWPYEEWVRQCEGDTGLGLLRRPT